MGGRPGRRVLVAFTDGADTLSKRGIELVIETAHRNNVTAYLVLWRKGAVGEAYFQEQFWRSLQSGMYRLADETGGRVWGASNLAELERAFKQVAQELRNQYVVGFFSPNVTGEGNLREIKVATDRKNLKVRARKRYYTPKN